MKEQKLFNVFLNIEPLFFKNEKFNRKIQMLIHGFESFQNPIIIWYTEDQQDSWTFTSHVGVVEALAYCLPTWVQSQLQQSVIL